MGEKLAEKNQESALNDLGGGEQEINFWDGKDCSLIDKELPHSALDGCIAPSWPPDRD